MVSEGKHFERLHIRKVIFILNVAEMLRNGILVI